MADSTSPKGNSSAFAKKIQRQLSRSKEKVLQRLGKTVESRDEQFEYCLQQFNDQQIDGNRIYKDLRIYINAVRDMREASRRLSQSLFDVYESDWVGEEDLGAIVEGEDLLWNDYEVKLLDQAVRTMESYVSQFPDVREKVAKRGRKLVDYDSSRHHLEALQAAKKKDDVKISKAEEEMNAAKSVYEGINNELKDELPAFHESRLGCYVSVFSGLSTLRDIFYKEMSTLNGDLHNVIKELQGQHPDKVFAVKGLQRYGSLKRRSLMSPKAWKTSFSDFHRSYSPKTGQRFSFRSPDKPRHGTLSREGSAAAVSPLSKPRDPDAESSHSEVPGSTGRDDDGGDAEPAGGQLTPGEALGRAEEEKAPQEDESEPPAPAGGDAGRAAPSQSSSEQDVSRDSVSLELQLSTAAAADDNGPLHIEEREDSPVTVGDGPKANGLENGGAAALNSDPQDSAAEKQDIKNTVV